MRRIKISRVLFFIVLLATCDKVTFSVPHSETYQDTRRLLSQLDDVRLASDKLVALFQVGDDRIDDLVRALDDHDKDISHRAQIVIRYLGNSKGMKAVVDSYEKTTLEYRIAGPKPLPLSEWDYKYIKTNFLGTSPVSWGEDGARYLRALAIDDNEMNRGLLRTMLYQARDVEEGFLIAREVKLLKGGNPSGVLSGKDLAKSVVVNAFFISVRDKQVTSSSLLGFNGKKDKALVELYINRGTLAEEWYHVVVKRHARGWKFFSISQVAVS